MTIKIHFLKNPHLDCLWKNFIKNPSFRYFLENIYFKKSIFTIFFEKIFQNKSTLKCGFGRKYIFLRKISSKISTVK